ncbi:hypothetical protein Cni_G04963 [Canna indica]|uniref:Homeobox-leucine zipper protein n=1 Tax=Canna indica TaxID=4628 RepID=A0AAQ3JUE4_9LILI|nr:hypothetical protein Cni_G04963 [Canna indica]
MKRALDCSENSLIPFCSSEEQEDVYGSEFHPIMEGMEEDDGGDEELCGAVAGRGGKKRRLSAEQVRALEKNFEVENKLEPERKVRLAKELGLQPRQVAVWFQNRRARWKTKQLERDYSDLKATYDALRVDFDALHRDKESLLSQIKELKAKLAANESSSFSSAVKEDDPVVSETAAKAAIGNKDGASDSDSSAVLNDAAAVADVENSPQLSAAMAGELGGGSCSSSAFLIDNPDSRTRFFYQHHEMMKMEEMEEMEEEEFLSDPCSSFFADEQAAATLSWYYTDHWN